MKKLFCIQGDVPIFQVEIPKTAKKKKVKTIRYGEVTNHSHRFSEKTRVQLLEEKDLTDHDKEIVALIKTQLKDDWRSPLLDKLKKI